MYLQNYKPARRWLSSHWLLPTGASSLLSSYWLLMTGVPSVAEVLERTRSQSLGGGKVDSVQPWLPSGHMMISQPKVS